MKKAHFTLKVAPGETMKSGRKERVLRACHASSIGKPGCEDGEMSMPVCFPSLQQQKGTSK